MEDLDRWLTHTRFSNPGRHARSIAALSADVARLNEIIQGVLVHSSWLREYGLDTPRLDAGARTTLPFAERLDDILARDPRPLEAQRPPELRSIGTCRDYALMLCAILRAKGIPARVRCGFAAYFHLVWEDHWVCEYWDARRRSWRLSDAQIDPMLKRQNRIDFNPADMPREVFLTAGEAWTKCRRAEADAGDFGHGETTGMWFIKVNVLRDHHVLNGRETSLWDRWREAPAASRTVCDEELQLLDSLAARLEQELIAATPEWIV
ncbi:transglutaminase domain-containing protein [Devosia nitrariae]|uniref:Transglutaminase-like domain-containing protein n=1 Tax=Devosia nitrariae TaxID=2071872 RepID=A0ABQ5WBN2_9HYPH|nr:transglutaminase domain-containing protein [Devosia nitrariae]GLQ57247.1 hypothetical protein GCM10010862_45060 [Devosia nitrariae]